MNHLSRRALLRSTALISVALASGCTALSSIGSVDMVKVADDVHTISGAISTVENAIGTLQSVPASVVQRVTALIENVKATAASVTATISSAASQPLVVRIEDDLSSAFTALKGSGVLPANMAQVFSDGLTVLGAVKTAIGLVSMIALAPSPGEVDAARLRLKAVAGRV